MELVENRWPARNQLCQLYFALAVPVERTIVRDLLQRFDQDAAEAVTAVEVHTHEFESNFIDPGAAQKNLATDLLYAH